MLWSQRAHCGGMLSLLEGLRTLLKVFGTKLEVSILSERRWETFSRGLLPSFESINWSFSIEKRFVTSFLFKVCNLSKDFKADMIKHALCYHPHVLDSPSSPLLAEPVKKILPSSATSKACEPSCPTENWMIFGDLVIGSSTHFPAEGPPCLIPRLWYFPV